VWRPVTRAGSRQRQRFRLASNAMIGDTAQHVGEPSLGVDAIEFGRGRSRPLFRNPVREKE
jgi:hypothetical protein